MILINNRCQILQKSLAVGLRRYGRNFFLNNKQVRNCNQLEISLFGYYLTRTLLYKTDFSTLSPFFFRSYTVSVSMMPMQYTSLRSRVPANSPPRFCLNTDLSFGPGSGVSKHTINYCLIFKLKSDILYSYHLVFSCLRLLKS